MLCVQCGCGSGWGDFSKSDIRIKSGYKSGHETREANEVIWTGPTVLIFTAVKHTTRSQNSTNEHVRFFNTVLANESVKVYSHGATATATKMFCVNSLIDIRATHSEMKSLSLLHHVYTSMEGYVAYFLP